MESAFDLMAFPRDPGSPKLRMVSWNLKYLAKEVTIHPNHHLTR